MKNQETDNVRDLVDIIVDDVLHGVIDVSSMTVSEILYEDGHLVESAQDETEVINLVAELVREELTRVYSYWANGNMDVGD